jgi:hypothetical protein
MIATWSGLTTHGTITGFKSSYKDTCGMTALEV